MVTYQIYLKVKPTVFADGLDQGVRKKGTANYTKFVDLSNSKDEGIPQCDRGKCQRNGIEEEDQEYICGYSY